MRTLNTAVNMEDEAPVYYQQPIMADPLFKPLPSTSDIMSELKQARDAYELAVAQEQKGTGFYQELVAPADEVQSRETGLIVAAPKGKRLTLAGNCYSLVDSATNSFPQWRVQAIP
jgi:rubrerythrin